MRHRSRCPGSMRPVSSMVTCTCRGTRLPAATIARLQAFSGGLRLEQVVDGLDDQKVDAASEKTGRLLGVGVTQVVVRDLTERRKLRAGAEVPCDESRSIGGREGVGGPPCDGRGSDVQLVARSASPYSASTTLNAPKASVSIDVHARFEERARCTPSTTSGRVTERISLHPSSALAAEVVGGQIGELQRGAHRSVEDDDPLGDGAQVCLAARRRKASRSTIMLQG